MRQFRHNGECSFRETTYLQEAERQLPDCRFYEKLDSDPTLDFTHFFQVVDSIFDVWWKVFNERPKVKINKFRYLFSWVTIGWYIQEAERKLSDCRFYEKLDSDPTLDFTQKNMRALEAMHARGHLDNKTIEYLTPEDPKPGRFYLLPKIHRWRSINSDIFSVGGPLTDTIGLPELSSLWILGSR
jgi:hypothetical protein